MSMYTIVCDNDVNPDSLVSANAEHYLAAINRMPCPEKLLHALIKQLEQEAEQEKKPPIVTG